MSLDEHATATATLHDAYPFLGMARSHHTNKRSQPLSFADKPYLIPLFQILPLVRSLSMCKATQTGISEMMIAYMLDAAGWNNKIVAYVLPQYKTSTRFVADRVDPLLIRTPAYEARLPGGVLGMENVAGGTGNLQRKRFGRRGSMLFLGSNTEADFVEFSCDIAVIDELDNCDQKNIAKIKDRVRESDCPQEIRISNPRVPKRRISRLWSEGTRGRWHHKCSRCGHLQALDWERQFVTRDDMGGWEPLDVKRAADPSSGDIRPVCVRCRRPWDRTADGSAWIAEFPGRDEDSLHISRLDVLSSRRDPQPMRSGLKEFHAARKDLDALIAWWAGFLGWCYQAEGMAVTTEMLRKAATGPAIDHAGGSVYEPENVVMGVDVGSVLNVKISAALPGDGEDDERHPYMRRSIWTGVVSSFEDLILLQERYHVDFMVIDAMPETRKAKEIRDYFIANGGCEVWLCLYSSAPRVGRDAFGLVMNYTEQTIKVDRTQLLDATLSDLEHGRNLLPSDVELVSGFFDQMEAPQRLHDPKTQRVVWDEGNDPDHYRHADAYERVALEIFARAGAYHG